MSDLWKRVGVALWGVPLLVFLIYQGGLYLLALVTILNAMALWEFYTMQEAREIHPYKLPAVIVSTAMILIGGWWPAYWLPLILLSLLFFFLMFLRQQKGEPFQNLAFTLAGFVYISLFLYTLLHLAGSISQWWPEITTNTVHASGRLILTTIAAIWICDTAAYFGGKYFGKHKLAPAISPKKTIEGGVSGLLFATIAFVGFGSLFIPQLPLWAAVSCGLLVGVFGQLGDLVESRFKRNAGVKDSSNLLPGHGGILDRFDSLIFVSPFLWVFFYAVGKWV